MQIELIKNYYCENCMVRNRGIVVIEISKFLDGSELIYDIKSERIKNCVSRKQECLRKEIVPNFEISLNFGFFINYIVLLEKDLNIKFFSGSDLYMVTRDKGYKCVKKTIDKLYFDQFVLEKYDLVYIKRIMIKNINKTYNDIYEELKKK